MEHSHRLIDLGSRIRPVHAKAGITLLLLFVLFGSTSLSAQSNTLTARAPDLTATEVRICTMLRMNLQSHEIADIFCITIAGVEFHRKHIRKKLKLKLRKEEKLPIVLGGM